MKSIAINSLLVIGGVFLFTTVKNAVSDLFSARKELKKMLDSVEQENK